MDYKIKTLHQIKPFVCFALLCFVLFCFVLSCFVLPCFVWWLWLHLSTMIVKMIVKICFLVQEPEENVIIISSYIQIKHKSTYLKMYLKKEIWSKKKLFEHTGSSSAILMRKIHSRGQKWFLRPYFPLIGVCWYSEVVLDFHFGHWKCLNREWGKGLWKNAKKIIIISQNLVEKGTRKLLLFIFILLLVFHIVKAAISIFLVFLLTFFAWNHIVSHILITSGV